jgi:ribosome-binding protein aMBF1 (putative translation factor)
MGKAVSAVMYCSFCGRESRQVKKLISGLGVYICDGCVTSCVAILEDRRLPDTPALRNREEYSEDELLDEIPRVAATTANVEADLRARIRELRQRGVAWSRIAAALGVTRQSAWERFTREDAPGS